MHVVTKVTQLRKLLTRARRRGKTIGFVPTMGAFHEGHLSLMRKCKKENDLTVVSIFVNPAQFAPHEDFKKYPRHKRKNILLAKSENVDIIFYPSVDEMYPKRYLTYINVEKITATLCGKIRPGHFRGVATIVGKLLNIILPNVMYLGQKDAQQCVVLKHLVRDLDFPVKIKILPTKRENNGLALSSRNEYLSKTQRQEAAILYKSLRLAKQKILNGQRHAQQIKNEIRQNILRNSSGVIDYIYCVDAQALTPLKNLKGRILIALAVRFGRTRLIDNILVTAH